MANMWGSVLVVVVLLLGSHADLDPSKACAGYEISIEKLKVCDGVPSLLTQENFNAVLQDNCTVTTSGCIAFDGFTTAKINWSLNFAAAGMVKKLVPDFPFEYNKNLDGCSVFGMVLPEYVHYISDLGLPTSCPVTGKRMCANNDTTNSQIIADFAKDPKLIMKIFLGMAVSLGYTSGQFRAVHDTGVTCVDFGGRLMKKKKFLFKKKSSKKH